jgi:ribosomal protein S6--L-glutamate ligase
VPGIAGGVVVTTPVDRRFARLPASVRRGVTTVHGGPTRSPGEFRSNLHRGGSAEVVKLTPEERTTAVRAAKAMGLRLAGVDILRSHHGPLVMEVNSSPGLEGIEATTRKDVAGAIVRFIEKDSEEGRRGDRSTHH